LELLLTQIFPSTADPRCEDHQVLLAMGLPMAARVALAAGCRPPAAFQIAVACNRKAARLCTQPASQMRQLRTCPGGVPTPALARRAAFRCSAASTRGHRAIAAAALAEKKDVMLRTVSDMGELTVTVIDGTRLVQEAMDRHKCAPAAGVALGRGLLATALIGAYKKDGEVTQVSIKGSGELGQMICISTSTGLVKGLVANPAANAVREDGAVNVSAIVGPGTVSVVRSHPLWKEPYTGTVAITTGEIAEDLAQYLLDSEQQQCALAAGVTLNPDGSVAAAAGFLIRALPLISDESVEILENNIKQLPSLTSMISDGKTCSDITSMILGELGAECAGSSDSIEPSYGPCDSEELRVRMQRAVATLGEDEVMGILEEQGKIEMTCDFCKFTTVFPREEVLETLEAAKSE